MEVEPDRVRNEGGNYEQSGLNEFFEIRIMNSVKAGASRMGSTNSGLQYTGTEEFYIPYDEIERIGIQGILQPNIKFYLFPWVLRVINVNPLTYPRVYRVLTDRTRDPYPPFTTTWDFENDTLGEVPLGWGIYDPSVSGDKIVVANEPEKDTQVLSIENSSTTEHTYAYLEATKYIPGGGVNFKFDFMIDWYDDTKTNGLLGFFFASPETPDIDQITGENATYIAAFQLSGSTIYMRTVEDTPRLIDLEITVGEWYSVEFNIDRTLQKLSGKINDLEFEATPDRFGLEEFPSAHFASFNAQKLVGGLIPGVGARFFIDNMEVGCINAL